VKIGLESNRNVSKVMGELDGQARKRMLTQGGIAAIALVTVLYMLANVAVVRGLEKYVEISADNIFALQMVVLPYETLVNSEGVPAVSSSKHTPESWTADSHR